MMSTKCQHVETGQAQQHCLAVMLDLEAEGEIREIDGFYLKRWCFVLAYIQCKLKEFPCLQALANVSGIS